MKQYQARADSLSVLVQVKFTARVSNLDALPDPAAAIASSLAELGLDVVVLSASLVT